jgi:hypothetical protein
MTGTWWRAIVESHPCPVCNAGPGEPCRTYTGNRKAECHADRARDADRCPGCGTRLAADADDPYCPHCRMVRDLVTERYRHRS